MEELDDDRSLLGLSRSQSESSGFHDVDNTAQARDPVESLTTRSSTPTTYATPAASFIPDDPHDPNHPHDPHSKSIQLEVINL